MLPVIANSTALGGEPVIGRVARAGFSDIWRFIRDEAGFSPEESREFIATGMLINTIVGLRLTGDYGNEVSATEVLDACFPDAVSKVRPSCRRSTSPGEHPVSGERMPRGIRSSLTAGTGRQCRAAIRRSRSSEIA